MSKLLAATLACLVVLAASAASLLISSKSGADPTGVPAEFTEIATPYGPAVLELFTSQGCSSCPPADRLAARLASDPAVIVISRPVTYWDRLGWKDTLANPANTDLQRAYAARMLMGENGVYTPQAVIDGRSGAVGSFEREVRSLIADAAERDRPQISISADDEHVGLSGAVGQSAQLSLIGVKRMASVAIGSGENGGREVHYTNVFQGELPLGEWNGGTAEFTLPGHDMRIAGADAHLLLLREGGSGPILAARWL